ncbi:MAG: hypothetical protein QM775_03205 [Pirellulales bacterium]
MLATANMAALNKMAGTYADDERYQKIVSGASDAKITATPAWVAAMARTTSAKSSRTPASVLKMKKLGKLTKQVAASSSGAFSAE